MNQGWRFHYCLLFIGLGASLTTGAFAFYMYGDFHAWKVVIPFFLLALGFFASLALFPPPSESAQPSLLWIFLGWIFFSWFSSFPLFLLVLVGLLIGAGWLFYQKGKELLSLSLKDWLGLFLLSFFLGVIALSGQSALMGCFSLQEQIEAGEVHPDTLYHLALASMIQSQGIISNGLHGLPSFHYHTLSHFVYGRISTLLDVTLVEAYGYLTAMVLIPLLFWVLLSLSEKIAPSQNRREFHFQGWLLGACFIGFLGRSFMNSYAAWASYFISESYLLGLILLLSLVTYLYYSEEKRSGEFLWVSLFLFFTIGSKISCGFMACLLVGLHELSSFTSTQWLCCSKRLLGYSAVGWIAYSLFGRAPLASETTWTPFEFFFRYGQASLPDASWYDIPLALFLQFFFPFLALIPGFYYYHYDRGRWEQTRKLLVASWIVALVSLVPLSLPIHGGGAYYFSNISMFLAIPILLSTKHLFFLQAENSPSIGWLRIIQAIVLWGFLGTLFYGFPYLKQAERGQRRWVRKLKPHPELAPYLTQLQYIAQDEKTQGLLVYLPKKEPFWSATSRRDNPFLPKTAFYIPVLASRPGLFSLPNVENIPLVYGGDLYSFNTFEKAKKPKIASEILQKETKKLGFEGYVHVRKNGYDIYRFPKDTKKKG